MNEITDNKYILNSDRTATILREGEIGTIGEVVHTRAHDGFRGFKDMKDVRICFWDFRMGAFMVKSNINRFRDMLKILCRMTV